jgi:PAS domain S-box-containing protein
MSRARWPIVYYLLAGFAVVTGSAALLLGRRTLDIYIRSVSQNQEWAAHLDEYAGLQSLAAEANAPANDVFASHDVEGELARLRHARTAFSARVDELRRHIMEAHPAEAAALSVQMADVQSAFDEMSGAAESTLDDFRAGGAEGAGRRMSEMDRSYARLLASLGNLRTQVSRVQQRLFARQTQDARRLQPFEVAIAALIAAMVGLALVYGTRIEREMAHDTELRQREVAALRMAEDAVRRAHRELEHRGEERARVQRESEAALTQAASEWRRTFDAIDSPVMILDLQGRMLRANATVRVLFGRGAADGVTGRIVTSLGGGEPWETASRMAREAREAGRPVSDEVRDPASGRSWEVSAYLASAEEGEDGRIIVVAQDTTRVLELQEKLRREETMAAVGALVAGVAHEVRNPIFAISSTLDAFEARFGGSPESVKYFPVLRREVGRLGVLMRDLLDYGRPPRLEVAPTSLKSIVADALRSSGPAAADAGVVIIDAVPPDLPPVTVDAARLAQVFQNVIQNAVLHSPRNGRVTVEAQLVESTSGPLVECTVRDEGSGFRAEDLPHVFEPLFTGRPGGTGLGLAIAQRLVDLHGGIITAANAPGGGARVTVRIPRHRSELRDHSHG